MEDASHVRRARSFVRRWLSVTDRADEPQLANVRGTTVHHDDHEFRRIYESEVAYVWSSLRRLGAPERDLEDLAHDLFVVVHRKLPEYDRTRPIRPWLFGIPLRIGARARRAPSRPEPGETSHEPVDPAPHADEQLADGERRRLVQR